MILYIINICRTRGYKYYGIASTTFDTGTQNVRRVNFPNSSLSGK